jgi:hypothetical protein
MKLYIILVLCIIAKVNGAFKSGSELTYNDSIDGNYKNHIFEVFKEKHLNPIS